jgi:hypothetical protein
MLRTLPPCLLLLAASFAFAQNSRSVEASASPSPVQVVYVVEGTNIVTYNVDSTLSATPVGTPLTVPNASTLGTLVPAPHGHFLYLVGYDANSNEYLWGYTPPMTTVLPKLRPRRESASPVSTDFKSILMPILHISSLFTRLDKPTIPRSTFAAI